MKNIWKNNSGFSIVIAMGLTIFIWLTALYILEYIIPFGRNVKWVENASKSYYQAASWVEDAFWFISQNGVGDENDETLSSSENIDYWYEMTSNGSQIPLSWTGDSEFDVDFNLLAPSSPIQLEVWNDMISDWNNVDFNIRVPNTRWVEWPYTLAWWSDSIVNWQLSTPDTTFNSDDSLITANDINSPTPINLGIRNGQDLDGNLPDSMRDIYSSNCGSGSGCILKLSIISDIQLAWATGWSQIPYLEYQIDFWWDSVPLRFVQIEATGKSFGFRKDLNVRVPQLTVDEAFDFTVLQ